jgi:hypothetical protein
MSVKGKITEEEKLIGSKGDFGQGNKLMEAKKKHELKKK